MPKFDPDKVVHSHRLDDLIAAQSEIGTFLIDFLSDLGRGRKDQAILEKWMQHFLDRDVPFAVCRHLSKYVLWKIDETGEQP